MRVQRRRGCHSTTDRWVEKVESIWIDSFHWIKLNLFLCQNNQLKSWIFISRFLFFCIYNLVGTCFKHLKSVDTYHQRQLGLFTKFKFVKSNLKSPNDFFEGLEYIEESRSKTGTAASFYCRLCDCHFTDPLAKIMHIKGRRHRLAYKVTILYFFGQNICLIGQNFLVNKSIYLSILAASLSVLGIDWIDWI